MDRKVIYAIAVVAILVVASVGVYFVMSKDRGADDSPSSLDGAELKVFGNINGDRYLDADDADMIRDLIAQGATAEEYPLADANRDGVIDSKDVDVVTAVAEGRDTTIWHINYHDVDGDSVMEEEIVSSHFPVRSVIISASANISMHLFSIGIIDEVKGAAYTDGTLDDVLYGSNYLDTSKVTKIGESVTDISLEDGQMGASDVIAQHDVTALITDWNQNYITNENDFENAGVDVIRVSCNSVDPVDMTHTMMLLGLLFQKVDRAEAYLDLNLELSTALLPDRFDGRITTRNYEPALGLALGITYHFKGRADAPAAPVRPGRGKPEAVPTLDDYMEHVRQAVREEVRGNLPAPPPADTVTIIREIEKPQAAPPAPRTIRIASLQFNSEQARPRAGQDMQIANIVAFAHDNPQARILIEGYADDRTGSPDYNLSLSRKRAQSVYDLLVKAGISPDRLEAVGHGSAVQVYEQSDWNRVAIVNAVW